ncbi:MAG: septum formation initiator family protein [Actinomycetota bacterium]
MAARRSARRSNLSLRGLGPILIVAVLACVVLAGLAVLPAKTWFSQRSNMGAAEAELARIEAETADLERQVERLGTDAEVELRARRDFDLVYPGEESYRIVPGEDAP